MRQMGISLILLITVLLAQSLSVQPALAMPHAQSVTVDMESQHTARAQLARSLGARHASIRLPAQFASRDTQRLIIYATLARQAVLVEDTRFPSILTETAPLFAETA